MGRPPRPLLTRDGIMRAALALVDEEGAAALSTTRVAARLGVKGPSLYNYVSSRDEIIAGVSDLIVAEMDLDPAVQPWTAALDAWARSYRSALARHPNMVPLLASRPTRSVAALQAYACAFAMLRKAGWPEDHVLPVVQSIEYLLIGSALHLNHPHDTAWADEELPPGLEPLRNAPADFREQAFETGLTALIRSFQETLDNLQAQHDG
ncbi:TetR/AcrR family transcriptional regulator C-terminal domain-containing protein [Kitasatospora sp. CM 4170]|uniref:TetR/AcrR family transcriptional regulator n=1 Tax=Kitasatospora aburaviensis TaxID=67265 RepID=A0ABW1F122_9ACTN|nr:TetR/AcrR family transcriptional regulator C-terminal domain-containing protein [Kitasatospora sp. CM 4170]WNM49623.1 TetR/AcrR family transcriptional regulator C-terminal domain-containing protein [Kitasatospora sp. CM 4170]